MIQRYEAFLSYARLDDENDNGRITDIRRMLSNEIATQLGEASFNIFQDIEDIAIGTKWQQVLDDNLDGTAMLIGFLSPRFFRRAACRNELERFMAKESATGRTDLFIPVQYVAVPETVWAVDPLATLVRERQMFKLDDLRFTDLEDMRFRARVSELAAAIVGALQRTALSTEEPVLSPAAIEDDADEEPGLVELLAAMEEAMPFLTESITAASEELSAIGGTMREESAELNASVGGTGNQKLLTTIRIAEGIKLPIDRMEQAIDVYGDELARVDAGVHALFHAVETREHDDPDRLATVETLRANGWKAIADIPASIGEISQIRVSLQPLMQQSSTLRKPLRRLESIVRRLEASAEVWQSWSDMRDRLLSSVD